MRPWQLALIAGPLVLTIAVYLWRTPRQVASAPYFVASWSALLGAGMLEATSFDGPWALSLRCLLTAAFAGAMLAGAYRQTRQPVPAWIAPGMLCLGLVHAAGVHVDEALALAIGGVLEAAILLRAARVVYARRRPDRSRLISNALASSMLAMAVLAAIDDPILDLRGEGQLLVFVAWLVLGMGAGFLQLVSWADRMARREEVLSLEREGLRRVSSAIADPDPRGALETALAECERVMQVAPLSVWIVESEGLTALRTTPASPRLEWGDPVLRRVLDSAEPSTWGEGVGSIAQARCFGLAPGFAARIGYGERVVGLVVGAAPDQAASETSELARDLAGAIGLVLGTAASWERQSSQARALEEQGLRLEQMVEAVPAGFLMVDEAGRIQHANRRLLEVLGLPPQAHVEGLEDMGRMLSHRIPTEGLAKLLDEASPSPTLVALESPRRMLSLTAHSVGSGASRERVFVARDVTEELELSERAHQMERLETVGTLAGGLAHDFNNQLTAILGNARLLLEEMGPEDPARRALLDLEESARHCAELTASLLSFARSEKTDLVDVDVAGVVQRAVTLVRPLLPRGVELTSDVTEGLGSVEADPVQLSRVLTNLLLNARDAVGSEGRIRISAERTPGDLPVVSFVVTDDGAGMSEEVRRRVFEPFFTASEAGRGSGLGLSVVYGIVSAQGGAVDVESAPGEGSTFRVHWPVRAGGLEEELPPAPDLRRPSTVLLAEDQDPVRRLVRNALERAGYRVQECADGREAIERYQELGGAVDLLLLDLSMPRMGGLEALSELRRLQPGVPAVVMSGHPDRERGDEEWPKDVALLAKPFGPKRLVAAVRRALG